VVMVMKISSESLSRQGARTEFLVLNRGFWWRRRSGSLSGKNTVSSILCRQGVYVGERMAGASSCQGGAARAGSRHQCVRATRASSPSCLLAPWVFWWNRIFDDFSWIFTESWFLHKNETPEQFCWKHHQSVLVVFKTHKLEEKQ
jgi:hypothetical protein